MYFIAYIFHSNLTDGIVGSVLKSFTDSYNVILLCDIWIIDSVWNELTVFADVNSLASFKTTITPCLEKAAP